MRKNIVHPGADELTYEIREIVEVAKKIEKEGQEIIWENIGDPIAKGEKVPDWIKEIVQNALKKDATFGYCPTKGLEKTREYIAYERNIEGGIQITADDILFFNGLGDAISKIYEHLHPEARVLGPNPAYPTHSSAEAAHAGSSHITYKLDPENGWRPDLKDIEEKVKKHPEITAILIVNPDNPTGFVYPQELVKQIVDIARKYDLFMISDEIYSNLFYGGIEHKKLASVISDVPGIAMRGLSKEVPWPGARCGWIEFYNRDKDKIFDRYTKSLVDAKMLEVCSTTLPQVVLPEIMGDSRYYPYLETRRAQYEARAKIAKEKFKDLSEIIVHEPQGAFYMTVVFKDGALTKNQKLDIKNKKVFEIVKPLIETEQLDKRFVYFLLASRGICVVPLSSGFNSDRFGFRFTLLESNQQKFEATLDLLVASIKEYLAS